MNFFIDLLRCPPNFFGSLGLSGVNLHLTTEHTENTEFIIGFFSVNSENSVVKVWATTPNTNEPAFFI
jgi:hypothetical protein